MTPPITPLSTSSPTPSSIRVSGPSGIVAAIPPLLGFEPTESLVVLCLSHPRGTVGPVVRVDLCDGPAQDAVIQQLVHCAEQHADMVAVVCYHDSPALPPCLSALVEQLTAADLPLAAVLSVHQGVIRSAGSSEEMALDPGCPVPGVDDEQVQLLTAVTALAGRQVLPSREALAQSIAGPSGEHDVASHAAISTAQGSISPHRRHRRSSPSVALLRRTDAAFTRAWAEQSGTGGVSLSSASELIALAEDVNCRDQMIARAVEADRREAVPMLISIARHCPDQFAAGICSVLAVAAYRFGDGALAHCALNRVLAIAPDHRLAHLMLSIISAGLPPSELSSMTAIAYDGAEEPGS